MKDSALLGAAALVPSSTAQASSAGNALNAIDLQSRTSTPSFPPLTVPAVAPSELAQDETFWKQVAERYRVTDGVTNMEAGYFGMMSLPVLEAFHRNIDRANRDSSYFARREYPAIMQGVRARVASFIGAKPTEIAFSPRSE